MRAAGGGRRINMIFWKWVPLAWTLLPHLVGVVRTLLESSRPSQLPYSWQGCGFCSCGLRTLQVTERAWAPGRTGSHASNAEVVGRDWPQAIPREIVQGIGQLSLELFIKRHSDLGVVAPRLRLLRRPAGIVVAPRLRLNKEMAGEVHLVLLWQKWLCFDQIDNFSDTCRPGCCRGRSLSRRRRWRCWRHLWAGL